MKDASSGWDPHFLGRSPAFDIFAPACERLNLRAWPDAAALSMAAASMQAPPRNSAGREIRFIDGEIDDGLSYEQRAYVTGEIACRPRDWHDLMNALIWMTFPCAKATLNARHVAAMVEEAPGQRGRVRDTLTVFDEGGAIVLSSDAAVLEAIRGFRWKDLFWTRRAVFTATTRIVVFGHAMHQKLLEPFIGVSALAVLLEAPQGLIEGDTRTLLAYADDATTALIGDTTRFKTPQALAPLPILGVPGWFAQNADPAFYDNITYFRAGRRRAGQASRL